MSAMIQILIVEDEKPISNLIRMSLTRAGYSCTCVYDGNAAADLLEEKPFDLILLDVMLPGVDGFELMDYIRPLGIPVIFITAKNSVTDRVKGLRMGADDYIVKPFEVLELLARVDVVLRRYNKVDCVLEAGDLTIDTRSMQVRRSGEEIPLTVREFNLIYKLLSYPKKTFTRSQLMDEFWDSASTSGPRTVDVYMVKLREKFADCADFEIVTVHGLGYKAVLK